MKPSNAPLQKRICMPFFFYSQWTIHSSGVNMIFESWPPFNFWIGFMLYGLSDIFPYLSFQEQIKRGKNNKSERRKLTSWIKKRKKKQSIPKADHFVSRWTNTESVYSIKLHFIYLHKSWEKFRIYLKSKFKTFNKTKVETLDFTIYKHLSYECEENNN